MRGKVKLDRDLTTGEVARRVGVSGATVRKWCRKKLLKAYRIGVRGDLRIRRADLERFQVEHGMIDGPLCGPEGEDKTDEAHHHGAPDRG